MLWRRVSSPRSQCADESAHQFSQEISEGVGLSSRSRWDISDLGISRRRIAAPHKGILGIIGLIVQQGNQKAQGGANKYWATFVSPDKMIVRKFFHPFTDPADHAGYSRSWLFVATIHSGVQEGAKNGQDESTRRLIIVNQDGDVGIWILQDVGWRNIHRL